MQTNLETAIIATKCRKGKAHAITKRGAYWLACPPIRTRAFGGDGIGQSSADGSFDIELRHYRDGCVTVKLVAYTYHQNHGSHEEVTDLDFAEEISTVEDLIIILRNTNKWEREALTDYWIPKLTEALTALGLPEYPIPSPDDEPTPA